MLTVVWFRYMLHFDPAKHTVPMGTVCAHQDQASRQQSKKPPGGIGVVKQVQI